MRRKHIAVVLFFLVSLVSQAQKKDSSNFYFKEGFNAFQFRKFKMADSLFSLSIKIRPSIDAYFNRAASRERLGSKKGFCEDISEAAKLGDIEARGIFCQSCGKATDTSYFANDNTKSDRYHYYYYKVKFISEYVPNFDLNIISSKIETKVNEDLAKSIDNTYKAKFGPDKDGICNNAEVPPTFTGGDSAFKLFIKKNLIIPDRVKSQRLSGKVILRFVVDEKGVITNLEMYKGLADCMQCGNEALKMAKLMPPWIPGKTKGIPVKCRQVLNVDFQ